jgi:SPP1 gp7 family putative phage head morphogenesis protein
MSKVPAFGLGLVAPRDASAFFASKKGLLPSYNWDDVYAGEHAAGVAVAGITQRDVLQLFADELQRTIDAGGDLRDFKHRVQPALAKAGFWGDVEVTDPLTGDKRTTKFNQRRLELIFNTNVRSAQAAGQYTRALAAKADFPYLVYLSQADEAVRPLHRQWHGTVLPVEHPFWQTHLPPCGWNCRCRFMSVTEADIERFAKRGVPIKREPPKDWGQMVSYTRKGTGETVMVPRGIDPGFDHNPALSRLRGVLPKFVDMPVQPKPPTSLAPLPRLPLPTPVAADVLLPPGLEVNDYIAAFMAEFGPGPELGPKVFTDVAGQKLVLDKELFWSRKGPSEAHGYKIESQGRAPYMRLLTRAIAQPDEIWERQEVHGQKGKPVMRRRYMARFSIAGYDQPVIGVFEWGPDGWSGITAFQAADEAKARQMLDLQRWGTRVYVRP